MTATPSMTATASATPIDPRTRGDRAWPEAGRETIRELAREVRQRAKAIRDQADVDGVHDMRTATRRLRTAISLFGSDARRADRAKVETELKRVARRLGDVRDLDVLLAELGADGDLEPLRRAWRGKRETGAKHLASELAKRRFPRSLRAARQLVPASHGTGAGDRIERDEVERIATRGPGLMWSAFGRVLAFELDPATADPAVIHRMRIAAKKLRYTLEAFADALEPGATLIQEVTALQDAAGEMHDAIVAADRAGSDVKPRDLSAEEQSAIEAFAEAQRRRAEGLRPQIRTRLRTVRGRAFREALGRAVARMGHVPT